MISQAYLLAVVLQHYRGLHDVFLDDRSDANSRVLRTKTKKKPKMMLMLANERFVSNVSGSVVEHVITQVRSDFARQRTIVTVILVKHYYTVALSFSRARVTLFRAFSRDEEGSDDCCNNDLTAGRLLHLSSLHRERYVDSSYVQCDVLLTPIFVQTTRGCTQKRTCDRVSVLRINRKLCARAHTHEYSLPNKFIFRVAIISDVK